MVEVLAAFLIYAVFHSILAGKNMKTAVRQRLGERAYQGIYRIGYNIIAVITILPILILMQVRPGGVIWSVPDAGQPFLLAIRAVGMVGFVLSLVQIDLARFAGLRQLYAYLNNNPLPLPDEPLQTGGVYRLVRHPLYLFSLMLTWSMVTMTSAFFGFALAVTLYFIFGSRMEEKRLLDAFGQRYADYAAQVPGLIPFSRLSRRAVNKA